MNPKWIEVNHVLVCFIGWTSLSHHAPPLLYFTVKCPRAAPWRRFTWTEPHLPHAWWKWDGTQSWASALWRAARNRWWSALSRQVGVKSFKSYICWKIKHKCQTLPLGKVGKLTKSFHISHNPRRIAYDIFLSPPPVLPFSVFSLYFSALHVWLRRYMIL